MNARVALPHLPAAHSTHTVEELEPTAALHPAAQATHAEDDTDPVAMLYVPVAHKTQELCAVKL